MKISRTIKNLLLATIMILTAGAVKADTINFDIYNPNQGISAYPSPYLSVELTVPDGGGPATFVVTGDTTAGFTYRFSSFGVNTTQPVVLSNFSQPGFVDASIGNQDGFGTFDVANGQPGSSSAVDSMTFTATGTNPFLDAEDVIATNLLGFSAASHIYVFDSNGNPLATGFGANGTDDTAPEPANLILFGSGLLTIAGLIRRKAE